MIQVEAHTFRLTAILMDSRLLLTLEDFVDWVAYEKEYTEKDIGEEIHNKMDLADVFSAFIYDRGDGQK